MEGGKEEKPKKRLPNRTVKNGMHVQCEKCKVNLKLDDASTKNCKCYRYYYCGDKCKRKCGHAKSCEPFNSKKKSSSLPTGWHSDKEISALRHKSFEELMEMEDNPMACNLVSLSLTLDVFHAEKTKDGASMVSKWDWKVPPKYAALPFITREKMSIEWLMKAYKLGDISAAWRLGHKICCDFTLNLHLDLREGLDCLAQTERPGVWTADIDDILFNKVSTFLNTIHFLHEEELKEKQYGLGAIVALRCSDLLLDIIQDKPGVGLSKDEWGFRELHQLREKRKKSGNQIKPKMIFPWSYLHFMDDPGFALPFKENRNSIMYVTAPSRDPDGAMNDLRRIVEGPRDVELSDHFEIGCLHHDQLKEVDDSVFQSQLEELCLYEKGIICRLCFMDGYDRARAVASGAYSMSKIPSFYVENSLPHFSVIYETEDEEYEDGQKVDEEVFLGYCKAEVNTVLRYLSLHSADVDPRSICLNPDLYWSIIWYYGSITKALKEAGGQRLYDIGFGQHEVDLSNKMKILSLRLCPIQLSFDLIPKNYVSKLSNKKMEVRYCCSNPDCYKLEDAKKFLSCSGCLHYYPRKYCSKECQEEDWGEHQKACQSQSQKELNNNLTRRPAQQKKKGKSKKMF